MALVLCLPFGLIFPCQKVFFRTIPIYIDNFLTEKQPVNLTRNKGYLRCGPVRAMGAMALKRRENCFDRGV